MCSLDSVSIQSRARKLRLRNFSESSEERMNIHKNARLTPIPELRANTRP